MLQCFLTITVLLALTACQTGGDVVGKVMQMREMVVQATASQEQPYVAGIQDMPLYPGFEPVKEHSGVYNTLGGRIVEVEYQSPSASISAVREYYAAALPELGWQKKGATTYTREGEELKLELARVENAVSLKFSLNPAAR